MSFNDPNFLLMLCACVIGDVLWWRTRCRIRWLPHVAGRRLWLRKCCSVMKERRLDFGLGAFLNDVLRLARAVRKTENLATAELWRSNEQSQAKSRLTPLPSPYKAPSDLPGSVPLTSDLSLVDKQALFDCKLARTSSSSPSDTVYRRAQGLPCSKLLSWLR